MSELDRRIIKFIKKHHVFTLSTNANSESWCCSCFYAFDEAGIALIFTSDENTRHFRNMVENKQVSGTIHLETNIIGKIRGIQFSGTAELPEGEKLSKVKRTYLMRFPFAVFMNTTLWILHFDYIKMTDNRLGFGKKLIWQEDKS